MGLGRRVDGRNRPHQRPRPPKPNRFAVVIERQRPAAHERVGGAPAVDGHRDQASKEGDPEGQLANRRRQPRTESKRLAVVPHSSETLNGGDPRARRRAHVDAVPNVALEIVQVHERRLGQVVVRQPQVPDLGRDDGLRT